MSVKTPFGFTYQLEYLGRDGRVLGRSDQFRNLIPDEGRLYIESAAFAGGSQFSAWYIGLYSGAHTPDVGDTMATIVASATEITTYTEAARPTLVYGSLVGGVLTNSASPAVYTFNATTTVRGVFISSNSVKGGTTGILLSVALAPAAVVFASAEQVRVTAQLSLNTM